MLHLSGLAGGLAGGFAISVGLIYVWNRVNNKHLKGINAMADIRKPGVCHVKGREIEGGKFAKTVSESYFKKGDVVVTLKFVKCANKTYQTLQLGLNTHAIEIFSSYFNHHCDPTVKIEVLDEDNVDKLALNSIIFANVIALKDIDIGDEINFAYFTTEWDMEEKFKCRCASPCCVGFIGGASTMAPSVLQIYKEQLLPHIKHRLL